MANTSELNSKNQKTSQVQGNKGGQASSMADLMQKSGAKMTPLKKGENVDGTITKLTAQDIRVDLGGKAEAVVLEKDRKILRSLLSTLKVGDTVTVSVLNPESDFGYPVVSLRRFMDEDMWKRLEELQKSAKKITVTINEATRGGFMVETEDGISGFLPNSQTSFVQNSSDLIGKTVEVVLLESNKAQRKIIFSQKATTSNEEFLSKTKQLKTNGNVQTTISNVTSFGLFTYVKLPDESDVDGFIHASEVAWEGNVNLEETFKAGQTIEATVIGVDKEAKRVNLSIKRLTDDPFTEQIKDVSVDQKVSGKVTEIIDGNIQVDLSSVGEGMTGIIPKDKVPPTMSFEKGQAVQVTISEIDTKKRRILVSPVLLRKTIGYR